MLCRITARHIQPLWLLLLLILAVNATADPSGQPAEPHDAGLLFELTPPDGGSPSYLFGTIHSEDPRVLDLPRPVALALESAGTVVLEVVPDAASMQAAAAAMRLAEGERLAQMVPPDLYRRCLEVGAARGLPEEALAVLKPWAVMLLMSMPKAETGEFLDRRLYALALEQGKPALGLETTAEQLSLFEQFSAEEQQGLLRAAITAQAERQQKFEELVDAYLRGALDELVALSDAATPGLDPALNRRFRDVLIDARNRRMLHRLAALPSDGRYFIGVGALHLPGPAGLLTGLEEAGFEVRRLY
jgi:hypothetical protein